MAIMTLNSKMVYWKIEVKSSTTGWTDILSMAPDFGHYLSSITIKDGIVQKTKNKKKEAAPSELEVAITSKNYVENIFTEGCEIRVYLGYDKTDSPLVFQGEIRNLPDGGAREMLNYTVKAYSSEVVFSNIELNHSFAGRTKSAIIIEIAERNKFNAFVDVDGDTIPKAGFTKIQKGITDMELLDKFAADWGCTWWYDQNNNEIVFIDFNRAHEYGDRVDKRSFGLPYTLGYRTDKAKCNVESVDWSATPRPGGSEVEAMVEAFNEFGKDPSAKEYKLVVNNQTWQLKDNYRTIAKEDPIAFGKYTLYAAGQTISGNGYDLLRKFFVMVHDNKHSSRRNMPDGGGESTGIEINVHLNEGDPYLKPPRTANLYSGVVNPKVDNALLPAWIFQYGVQNQSVAKLNVNETVLTYKDGMLQSQLTCTLRSR